MKITKQILFKLDIITTDDLKQKELIEDFKTQHTGTFVAKPLADKIYKDIENRVNNELKQFVQPNKLKFKSSITIGGIVNEMSIIFNYKGEQLTDEQANSLDLVTEAFADEFIKNFSMDFDYKVFLKQYKGTVKTVNMIIK